jgi:diguanylate cyclase (GGDEF)-like protein
MPQQQPEQHVAERSITAGDLDDPMRSRVLRALLWTFITLTGLIGIIALADRSYSRVTVSLVAGSVYAILLIGHRRWGTHLTGYLCTIWYFLVATGAMASGNGIHDVTTVLFPAGMFIGAMLLDRRHVLPMIAVAVITVTGIGVASVMAPTRTVTAGPPDMAEVAVIALLLLVSGVLAYLIVGSLQEAIADRQHAEEALERGKEELEARNESLQVISELAHRLHRTQDMQAIANQTVDVLVHHRHPPSVGFYVHDSSRNHLVLIASHGFTDHEMALGARLPVDGSLSGHAFRQQIPVTSEDFRGDARVHSPVAHALLERGVTKALAVPLAFGGRALGTMTLLFGPQRILTQLDVDTFRAIGQTVALAMTNARHLAGIEHQALHDPLTGLPNRAGLHRRFMTHKARGEELIAFMLLDITRFREINDALGHNVGDEILVKIASRLTEEATERHAEAFRLGGDEFAVLLPGLTRHEEARRAARQILQALQEPFALSNMPLEVGASAGISYYPDDGDASHELLRSADIAMYHAKNVGGGLTEYSQQLDEHTPERLAMTSELGRALREGELAVYFQPKVRLDSGAVIGFEALVRWPHPRLGLLSPADFLHIAESSDMIHTLTYWVVEKALIQLREWHRSRPYLTMAINLSVRNLLDPHCAERLEEIFDTIGVDPAQVELELTETAVMTDPDAAMVTLGRITATGARLAIDDFGTGYASLTYLQRFPVSVIKIDRTFVRDMASGGPSLAIVRSTIELARSLGLTVVAEGIEDRESADTLREIGCDLAQGYYFARPGSAQEIDAYLSQQETVRVVA